MKALNKKWCKRIQKQYDEREKNAQISNLPEEQFQGALFLACIAGDQARVAKQMAVRWRAKGWILAKESQGK